MKFAPMNYHYLRYPIKKFLDKVESSPFDSIDLYCSAPQLNIFDYSLSRLIELDRDISFPERGEAPAWQTKPSYSAILPAPAIHPGSLTGTPAQTWR